MALAVVIECPDHWGERTAEILAERLMRDELPEECSIAVGQLSDTLPVFETVSWENGKSR